MDLKHLEKLESHFTWDLGWSKNELKELLRGLEDVDQERCTWLVHHYNLLGYIQQALGSNTEALKYLHKAESVIQKQETEKAGVQLQVNKANLAWVYFHLGDMDKSKGYLEEVERLQQMHPAPSASGCTLHPEVSGEKGWTLMKFKSKSKKDQAIDCFKMALKAQPQRKEWHKGLAITLSKTYTNHKCLPEHKDEILKQLKIAHEIEPNSLILHALYLEKLSEVQPELSEREMPGLLERTLETGNLEGLGTILRYYRTISEDKALKEAKRAQEKFPSSIIAMKHLANCYKWKVYKIKKDSEERQTLARKSTELFEEVVTHYPHSLRAKIALASMHHYTDNNERVDEIYQQLLAEKDLSPYRQQYIYYNYACHLYYSGQKDSINFHMKVAEIPNDTVYKENSIKILEKTVKKGKDPLCEKILEFLKDIQ